MAQLQIEIPCNAPEYLMTAIEERLYRIGESYYPNKSYQDDLEISALLGTARALGFDISVRDASAGGFELSRKPFGTNGS